jgi:excisionase family DNA binding protein
MDDNKPIVLTVPEVARTLGLSRGKTYALIGSGEIPSLRLGRSIRVPEYRFRQWLEGTASDTDVAATRRGQA